MNKNIEYCPYLSIGKGVAALLIVVLHTAPLENISKNLDFIFTNIFSRFAVPFFFIVSGILYKKKISKAYTSKYIKKIISIYLFWIIVYIPHKILYILKHKDNIINILKTILFDFIWNGFYQHMWFIPALVLSLLLIYYLDYILKINTKLILVLTVILYIWGILIGMYSKYMYNIIAKIFLPIFISPRNGLMFGFPLVFWGYLINERKNIYDLKHIIFYSFVSIALSLLEILFVYKYNLSSEYSYGFFTFLFPLLAASFCNINSDNEKIIVVARYIDKYTMGLYFIHPLILILILKLLPRKENIFYFGIIRFLITLFSSLVILFLLQKIFRNTKIRQYI